MEFDRALPWIIFVVIIFACIIVIDAVSIFRHRRKHKSEPVLPENREPWPPADFPNGQDNGTGTAYLRPDRSPKKESSGEPFSPERH